MKLLHWCTVVPEGPSSLAAIRFAKPVRVKCIRIFPSGGKPFEQCPDIVGETEPDSFLLDVYFNAQPVHPSSDSKEKQRAANALVPTTIAYAGGQVDCTLDLGTEYATRLMIVKGQFDTLSLAVYGEIVSETIIPPLSAEEIASSVSKPVPTPEKRTVPASIDPAHSSDPTFLARNLLSLLEESPPLSLISRLMFCLKPDNDDWDDPDFPYLYVDFDRDIFQTPTNIEDDDETLNSGGEDDSHFDIEAVLDAMSKPVSDDLTEDMLTRFAQVVADHMESKNKTQASNIAKLFKLAACQRPSLALALCQAIELDTVFDVETLDTDTLLDLLDASSNADIARYLHTADFMDVLSSFLSSPHSVSQPKSATQAAERLRTRLVSWEIFEDALSNQHADFEAAVAFLGDIGSGEQSLGIWLDSMTGHIDLVSKLMENQQTATSLNRRYPKLFVRNNANAPMFTGGAMTHDEFIAFVRAFIGVASVLSVWAWSDSLGDDVCRERTLGVLRLWQGTEEYREIVNYLLILRQFTLRLKWIISNDTPRKSGIFGEQILTDLLDEPLAALNDDLVQTVLSLKQPLSYIPENDRLSMRKIALVVEDGLPAAVEELAFTNTHPLSYRRLRILRVSIALVERELKEDPQKGDWNILQTIWDEQSMAFVPRLAELVAEIAQDLNGYFRIVSPFPAQQQSHTQPHTATTSSLPQVLSQLFPLTEAILALLIRLIKFAEPPSLSFSISAYTLRSLVLSVADVFTCTDEVGILYAQGTPASISAQSAHQACIDFLQKASTFGPGRILIEPQGGKSGAEIVMSVLLKNDVGMSGRDPAYHLLRMFTLVDCILPDPSSGSIAGEDMAEKEDGKEDQEEHWVLHVLPNLLDETQEFFRRLDVESKVQLLRRLVRLDSKGLAGMAEYLFDEEMKLLQQCTKTLVSSAYLSPQEETNQVQKIVLQYQIGQHLRLIGDMLRTGSDMLEWCLRTLKDPELFTSLSAALSDLSTTRIVSPHLDAVTEMLLLHYNDESIHYDDDVKLALIVLLLRTIRLENDPAKNLDIDLWSKAIGVLNTLSSENLDFTMFRQIAGQALAVFGSSAFDVELSPPRSGVILSFMTWLTSQPSEKKLAILCGIKADSLTDLYDALSALLPMEQHGTLDELRTKITVDEDEVFSPDDMNIPDTLQLSLQELQDILSPPSFQSTALPSTPSRTIVPDVLGLVISPPAALLRSSAATGLTKTYSNNDFRELRQATVARQNTSRLPSMHVDVGISGRLT